MFLVDLQPVVCNLQTNEEENQQEKGAKFRLGVSHGFEGQQLDFVWAGLQQSLWQRKEVAWNH